MWSNGVILCGKYCFCYIFSELFQSQALEISFYVSICMFLLS